MKTKPMKLLHIHHGVIIMTVNEGASMEKSISIHQLLLLSNKCYVPQCENLKLSKKIQVLFHLYEMGEIGNSIQQISCQRSVRSSGVQTSKPLLFLS